MIDPAKLNAVLSAFAESLRGRGELIGQAITPQNDVLQGRQSADAHRDHRLETVRPDHGSVFDSGTGHPSRFDSFTTTGRTISTQAQALDDVLLAVGRRILRSGITVLGYNHDNLVHSLNVPEPTTALLQYYSPSHTCMFQGAQWFLENGGRDAPGRQRQIGDHGLGPALRRRPVPVPDNLPKVNAQRRPRRQAVVRLAAQSVGELPGQIPRHRHRLRHGRTSGPTPASASPAADYFLVTRAVPEPPSIIPVPPAPGPLPRPPATARRTGAPNRLVPQP